MRTLTLEYPHANMDSMKPSDIADQIDASKAKLEADYELRRKAIIFLYGNGWPVSKIAKELRMLHQNVGAVIKNNTTAN